MNALNKKVLVVDDDPVVGNSFNRVLTAKGYVVVTASNGHEALSKLDEGNYDCVFTDIRMPGMDGLELAERVHARPTWTPVVIVTGYGNSDSEARARAAGVSAFLHKPLSPEMIEQSALAALAAQPDLVAPPKVDAAVPTIGRAEISRTIENLRAEVHGAPNPWRYAAAVLAAPVVSLAFVVVGPFLALAALAGMGLRGATQQLAHLSLFGMVKTAALVLAGAAASLAFIVLGPPIGLLALVAMALRAAVHRWVPVRVREFLRNATLFFAAPFIGLAYILAMPVVGLGALVWLALRGRLARLTPSQH